MAWSPENEQIEQRAAKVEALRELAEASGQALSPYEQQAYGDVLKFLEEEGSSFLSEVSQTLGGLAEVVVPLMSEGGSVVGLDFDATQAWPAYNWMGVAKAALESASRYLARSLGGDGIALTSQAGPRPCSCTLLANEILRAPANGTRVFWPLIR